MGQSEWPTWCCPLHRKPLRSEDKNLICPDGDRFEIKNGIPRFVPESSYADAFGAQWKRYRLTQLDSYVGFPITRDRARRCIGENLWRQLRDKQVLECGCGAGRFTEVLLLQGACVTSVDLSDAVEANQENFPQGKAHRIAQADILSLPFAEQQFDVVFCLGVIQHTPNPEETIACLYRQVKPGGTLVIDHYTHSFSWYTKSAPLFRWFLRRLPPAEGLRWCEKLVNALFPLHELTRSFWVGHAMLTRLSPVLDYYHAHPYLNRTLQREWACLDTHDSLTAWYRHVRTRGQIKRTLQRLGLEEIWCDYGGNGVEARGRRPLV